MTKSYGEWCAIIAPGKQPEQEILDSWRKSNYEILKTFSRLEAEINELQKKDKPQQSIIAKKEQKDIMYWIATRDKLPKGGQVVIALDHFEEVTIWIYLDLLRETFERKYSHWMIYYPPKQKSKYPEKMFKE